MMVTANLNTRSPYTSKLSRDRVHREPIVYRSSLVGIKYVFQSVHDQLSNLNTCSKCEMCRPSRQAAPLV